MKNPTAWFLIVGVVVVLFVLQWAGMLPKINFQTASKPSYVPSTSLPQPTAVSNPSRDRGWGLFLGSERGKPLVATSATKDLTNKERGEKWSTFQINRVSDRSTIYAKPAATLGMAFGVRGMFIMEIPGADGKYRHPYGGTELYGGLQYQGDTRNGSAEFLLMTGPGRYVIENPYEPGSWYLLEVS